MPQKTFFAALISQQRSESTIRVQKQSLICHKKKPCLAICYYVQDNSYLLFMQVFYVLICRALKLLDSPRTTIGARLEYALYIDWSLLRRIFPSRVHKKYAAGGRNFSSRKSVNFAHITNIWNWQDLSFIHRSQFFLDKFIPAIFLLKSKGKFSRSFISKWKKTDWFLPTLGWICY